MVSKASELFPEPDTPLTTVSLEWGISQEIFFRLWVRAPRITIALFAEITEKAPETCSSPLTRTRISHDRAEESHVSSFNARDNGELHVDFEPTPHCALQGAKNAIVQLSL